MAKGFVKRAATLSEEDIADALDYVVKESEQPLRDKLLILLTCRLGLRAQEAAMLYVEDILDPRGRVRSDKFVVTSRGAKYGKARTLPMRPDVRAALVDYLETYEALEKGPLFFNQYGEPLTSTAVQKQLKRIYQGIGLRGCSSHSGRRTFGTQMARLAAKKGGSLADVMGLMGHSDISTTIDYVEFTPNQESMVLALGT